MRKRVTSKRKARRPAPAKRKGLTLSQMIKIIGNQPARRKAPKRRKKITLADLFSLWS